MPLPLKTLRVFPNPWAFIHHEKGPQGACTKDSGGHSGAPVRFVGAERAIALIEKREKLDPRGDRESVSFTFPGLDKSLLKGTPEVVARTHYYEDRLKDGSLVPADDATAAAVPCRFPSLQAAKDFGVARFDAELGEGTWLELEKLVGMPAASSGKTTAQPQSDSVSDAKGGKS